MMRDMLVDDGDDGIDASHDRGCCSCLVKVVLSRS